MNLTGDADLGRRGLRVRPRQPRRAPTTSCSTPRSQWARKLAGQAPLAVEQIKQVSHKGDLDEGIAAEKAGLRRRCSRSEDAARGHRRLPREAHAASSRASEPRAAPPRLAELIRSAGSVVALTGAGISVPSGIPDFRSPGHRAVGERRPDGGRAHRRLPRATRSASGASTAQRFATLRDKQPNGAHRALAELERRGLLDAVITQNIDGLHARPGTARPDRGPRLDRARRRAWTAAARYELEEVRARLGRRRRRRAALRLRRSRSSPTSCCSASCCPRTAMERAQRAGRATPTCCCASAPRSRSTRWPGCRRSRCGAGGRVAIVTQGPTPFDGDAAVKLDGDVVAELEALVAAL